MLILGRWPLYQINVCHCYCIPASSNFITDSYIFSDDVLTKEEAIGKTHVSILHGYTVIDRTPEREDIMSVIIMFMDLSRCRHLFKESLITDIKGMSQFRSLAEHYHIN